MTKSLDPFRFLLIAVSGWMNQQQLQLMDYLREENRVLSEQLGQRRLRFNDDQRRRLGVRAKVSSRQGCESSEVQVLVPPIACSQADSASDACGGNDTRSARR